MERVSDERREDLWVPYPAGDWVEIKSEPCAMVGTPIWKIDRAG